MPRVPARPFERGEGSRARLRTIPSLPQPGDIIAGKYAVVRTIGEGGMGVVYEATHLRLRQRLAIKVLRPDVPDFAEVVTRFEREARAAAQLQSIHTARVIDVDALPNGLPYIVLEFLDGRDLDAELEATGPMPVEDAAEIVLQVAAAMAEAHALGIVHRDLKPTNLFVCRVGEHARRVVKVLDFGISKSEADDSKLTPSHAYFGTPHYAAPEQLRAASMADARSDVWSLGAILFELLTGQTPFVGSPTSVITKVVTDPVPWPTDLRPDLPVDLARVVMRALQRDPRQRFQTMRELAQALEPFGPKQSLAQAVAEAPRGRGKLGEILVADGLITAADLECALAEQRRSGKLLGRVFIDLKLVSQVDLLTALAKQQGVIVTPESPSPIEHEKLQRAATTAPPVTSPKTHGRWRHAWIATVVVGLALGIGAAAWLSNAMKSRTTATGLVVAPTASPMPAVTLMSRGSSDVEREPPVPSAAPNAHPARPGPARAPASRHDTFQPTGI